MASSTFSKRLHHAAPHLGALLASFPGYVAAGIVSLGYFHPLVVLPVVAFVVASPLIGSVAVLKLQDRQVDQRGPTIHPYLWWAVAAFAGLVLSSSIAAVFTPDINAPNQEWQAADAWLDAAALFGLASLAISFCVPALRFIMWMIKPPPLDHAQR